MGTRLELVGLPPIGWCKMASGQQSRRTHRQRLVLVQKGLASWVPKYKSVKMAVKGLP